MELSNGAQAREPKPEVQSAPAASAENNDGLQVPLQSSEMLAVETLAVRSTMWAIFVMSLPLAFSEVARVIQDVTNSILLGRFETLALAAVSVSSIWTGITDVMVFSGIGQLSMFCSQANGAGNLRLVGTWLQIYLVFCTLAAVPLAALRWVTSPVLKALGVPTAVAELAGVYTVWSQGSVLFDLWFCAFKAYYAAQNIVRPDAGVDAVFIFINALVVYTFIHVLHLGIIGAALATSFVRCARTVVYVLYCRHKGYHRRTWYGWDWAEVMVWDRWRRLLAQTLPAALGGLAEELQFEVCTLLAARMGAVQSAAFSLVLNLLFISLLAGMAFGEATGIRMANFLGANQPTKAHFVARVGGVTSIGFSTCFAVLILAFMRRFAVLASRDPLVQHEIEGLRVQSLETVMLLNVFIFLAIVVTKQGRSSLVGVVIPMTCWLVGFPCSYFLSRHHGLAGIVSGLIAGYGIAAVVLGVAYLRSDWPALAQRAVEASESAAAEGAGTGTSCSPESAVQASA